MIQPDGEFQHSKYGFRLVNSEYIWGLTWVLMGLEREKLGLSNVKYLRLAMENSTLIFSHCQGATSSSLLIQLRPTLPHPLGQAFVWSMAHPAC